MGEGIIAFIVGCIVVFIILVATGGLKDSPQ